MAPAPSFSYSRARLVALSALLLFLELALIRWLGSEVIYLSYFSNFVLLGSFLGIGVGFLRTANHRAWFRYMPIALLSLVAVVGAPFPGVDKTNSTLIYVGASVSGIPPYVMLPMIFTAVAIVMAMLASELGAVFATFPPLQAYRLDITGSLIGIGAFSLLAFLEAPQRFGARPWGLRTWPYLGHTCGPSRS